MKYDDYKYNKTFGSREHCYKDYNPEEIFKTRLLLKNFIETNLKRKKTKENISNQSLNDNFSKYNNKDNNELIKMNSENTLKETKNINLDHLNQFSPANNSNEISFDLQKAKFDKLKENEFLNDVYCKRKENLKEFEDYALYIENKLKQSKFDLKLFKKKESLNLNDNNNFNNYMLNKLESNSKQFLNNKLYQLQEI